MGNSTAISFEEFKVLDAVEQKEWLTMMRNEMSNEQIRKMWKISINTLYKYVRDLKLPVAPRTNKKSVPASRKGKVAGQTKVPVEAYIEEVTPSVPEAIQQNIVAIKEDGFGFNLKGKHNAEKLIKRLEKLSLILSDEETEFDVDIRIQEVS